MEDLPLGRIAAFVPEFAVKDLPLGRTLIMMIVAKVCLYCYIFKKIRCYVIFLSNVFYVLSKQCFMFYACFV